MNERETTALELSKHAFELVKNRLPETCQACIYDYIYEHCEWSLGIETLIDN